MSYEPLPTRVADARRDPTRTARGWPIFRLDCSMHTSDHPSKFPTGLADLRLNGGAPTSVSDYTFRIARFLRMERFSQMITKSQSEAEILESMLSNEGQTEVCSQR